MNHFSLSLPPSSDTLWYTPTPMDHHHQKPFPFFYHPPSLSLSSSIKNDDVESDNSSSNNNNNNNTNLNNLNYNANDRSETTSSSPSSTDQEYMFEKPLTPSDVGKLNRLVIPKQHAEKYFPLAAAADSTAGSGGVLLGFEDESGKCWKFRYSYWNSSQSYVLTKGWSRYVKEKKLDAGDVVLFQRHRFEPDRFFIGWRRRGSPSAQPNPAVHHNYGASQAHAYNGAPHQQHQISSFLSYRPDSLHHAGTEVRQGGEKGRKSGVPNSKSVRLFGVNLECQIPEELIEEEEEEMSQTLSDGSSLSSQGQRHSHSTLAGSGYGMGPTTAYNYLDYAAYPPPNLHYNSHMDINFPQDVNQMRNRLR